MLRRARHRIDQQHQATGDRRGTREVEGSVLEIGAALAKQPRGDSKHEQADRNVDEEDPGPAQGAGQRAAEQHAGRTAAARGGAPDPESEVALPSFPEGRRQDRQGRGRKQRRAESLDGAESDQRALRPREAVEQRADREQSKPDDEQAPAAEQVRQAAAEQQHAAEEDRIGRDHPLQARLREVEIRLDRRQGDVHDCDVEDDHELGGDDHREPEPAPAVDGPLAFVHRLCHNF